MSANLDRTINKLTETLVILTTFQVSGAVHTEDESLRDKLGDM